MLPMDNEGLPLKEILIMYLSPGKVASSAAGYGVMMRCGLQYMQIDAKTKYSMSPEVKDFFSK